MGYTSKHWLRDLWLRVDKNGPRAGRMGRCWLWLNGKYGGPTEKEVLEGLLTPATTYGHGGDGHVLFWELANGPVPRGLILHHKCFNPPCVRASHMEPMTTAHLSHHRAVNGVVRVQELRSAMRAAKVKQADVAALVGISAAHLNELINGKKLLTARRMDGIMSAIASTATTKEAARRSSRT